MEPKPDWSTLPGAKVVADLVEWSYRKSPADDRALAVHRSSLFLESASSAGFFAPEAVEILKFKKGYPEMLLDQHPRQAAVPAGLGALAAALDSSGPAATGVLSERDQVSVHPSAERKNVGSLSWPTCCASSLALAQEKLKKELASKEKDLEKTPKANRIRTEQMAAKAPKRGKLWERSFLDDRAWAYLVSAFQCLAYVRNG
ncbi:hypothetical protein AK812_SmicGene7967 [Symbiodinium microadriaticum]|uniref:Uncharacterized protein n=1 Tax=Symbiodinium microadriaticum TaxID=2951 RepID=A0A1Q9EM50_SYMMI|nr:hypothetical protein AK812_SmicGene7967 [Symbiodinium microadriaticum]